MAAVAGSQRCSQSQCLAWMITFKAALAIACFDDSSEFNWTGGARCRRRHPPNPCLAPVHCGWRPPLFRSPVRMLSAAPPGLAMQFSVQLSAAPMMQAAHIGTAMAEALVPAAVRVPEQSRGPVQVQADGAQAPALRIPYLPSRPVSAPIALAARWSPSAPTHPLRCRPDAAPSPAPAPTPLRPARHPAL